MNYPFNTSGWGFMVTPEERAVIDKLADAYNLFIQLPIIHHADQPEFVLAIHAAQNIVLARAGLRELGIYRPEAIPKRLDSSYHDPENGTATNE